MPGQRRDPRVDDYIDALPQWQRAVAQRVRDLVHEADPEVEEVIKACKVYAATAIDWCGVA